MNDFNIKTYQPHEEEKEQASTSYLMSLVAMIIGLPMPIINLMATGIFYLMSRKATPYVRWHCVQALVSQVPLFLMNNILFWWTVRILLCWNDLSSLYISYFIVVNLYNIYDLVETILSATRTRKGILHRWKLYGEVTDWLLKQPEANLSRIFGRLSATVACFLLSLVAINQVDWMKRLNLRPTIVPDTLSEIVWEAQSKLMRVEERDETVLPIDSMVYALCQSNDIDTTGIIIQLSRSKEVNAFSTVGQHLVVNRGLIDDCKNQQELAGVLAHELAHLQLNHVTEGIRKQLALSAVMIFLSGNANSSTARDALADLFSNSISRDMETEADDTAVKYMKAAQLDPCELANFMERMTKLGLLSYLSDHPDSEQRAQRIKSMCQDSTFASRDILHPSTWEKLKETVSN